MEPMKRPDWSREVYNPIRQAWRWYGRFTTPDFISKRPKNAPGEWVFHPYEPDCSQDRHRWVKNEYVAWLDGRQWIGGDGMTVCADCGADGFEDAPVRGTWRYWPAGVPEQYKHLKRKQSL